MSTSVETSVFADYNIFSILMPSLQPRSEENDADNIGNRYTSSTHSNYSPSNTKLQQSENKNAKKSGAVEDEKKENSLNPIHINDFLLPSELNKILIEVAKT